MCLHQFFCKLILFVFFSKEKTSAIFLHNAAEQWIDVNSEDTEQPSAYFMVERAAFDLFVLLGPTPKDIVRQFTTLTGRAHLPQVSTQLV